MCRVRKTKTVHNCTLTAHSACGRRQTVFWTNCRLIRSRISLMKIKYIRWIFTEGRPDGSSWLVGQQLVRNLHWAVMRWAVRQQDFVTSAQSATPAAFELLAAKQPAGLCTPCQLVNRDSPEEADTSYFRIEQSTKNYRLTLKIETLCTVETSVSLYQSTGPTIPEDVNPV
jgi:hypothetical protein